MPHKLDDEVMEFVITAIEDDTTLKAPALSQLVEQKFQLKVHPRTIEKKLADVKKGQCGRARSIILSGCEPRVGKVGKPPTSEHRAGG